MLVVALCPTVASGHHQTRYYAGLGEDGQVVWAARPEQARQYARYDRAYQAMLWAERRGRVALTIVHHKE